MNTALSYLLSVTLCLLAAWTATGTAPQAVQNILGFVLWACMLVMWIALYIAVFMRMEIIAALDRKVAPTPQQMRWLKNGAPRSRIRQVLYWATTFCMIAAGWTVIGVAMALTVFVALVTRDIRARTVADVELAWATWAGKAAP